MLWFERRLFIFFLSFKRLLLFNTAHSHISPVGLALLVIVIPKIQKLLILFFIFYDSLTSFSDIKTVTSIMLMILYCWISISGSTLWWKHRNLWFLNSLRFLVLIPYLHHLIFLLLIFIATHTNRITITITITTTTTTILFLN